MDAAFTDIEVAGQRVRVARAGEGPAAVVLHGWGGRIESMAPVVDCLSASHQVVALDLPGFGESPPPRGVWATPDYAEFVADVLDRVGVGAAPFVGHSFGAKTSFYLAATHADRVTKLVLVGSPGVRLPPSMAARFKKGAARAGRVAGSMGPPGRALKDALYRRIGSSDYRDAGPLRSTLVKVVNEDFRHLLPRIDCPVLLVWGERDDAVSLAAAKVMEELIPDAGLVVFEGAGHFAYLDEPARFCRIVRTFFGA